MVPYRCPHFFVHFAMLLLMVIGTIALTDLSQEFQQHELTSTLQAQLRFSCGRCCYAIESADHYRERLPHPFYAKVINYRDYLITSSADVSDEALFEAALTFARMTRGRNDLVHNLVKEDTIFVVLGKNELTSDVPEYEEAYGTELDWARGLGATQWVPVSSCAEENLMCYPSGEDSYYGENICIHELAHSLAGSSGGLPLVRYVEPGSTRNLDNIIRILYHKAVEVKGLYKGTYPSTNRGEYWAEGVQSYFNANRNELANTRSALRDYDLPLFKLIKKVFRKALPIKCPKWRTCKCDQFICPS